MGRTQEEATQVLGVLPGKFDSGAAEAAATAGTCVHPHGGVLQCPHYCLLAPKTFYHEQHQQVKANSIKPEGGERGWNTYSGKRHPFTPEK